MKSAVDSAIQWGHLVVERTEGRTRTGEEIVSLRDGKKKARWVAIRKADGSIVNVRRWF